MDIKTPEHLDTDHSTLHEDVGSMMMKPKIIKLTLNSLLQNPTGFSTSYMASRKHIIENLENRYQKLLVKHKKFVYKTFKVGKDYLFLFEIPSESLEDFYYDVCVYFYIDSENEDGNRVEPSQMEKIEEDRTINRYNVKVFSNSPAFTFTYAYVLNKHNLIPDLFRDKCSKISLEEPPKIKNPVEVYGFEKSLYFASLYLRDQKLYNKYEIQKNLFIFDKIKMLLKVRSSESKLKDINVMKKKLIEEKKQKKRRTKMTNLITKKSDIRKSKKRRHKI